MRCPYCKSENAHFYSKTTSTGPSIWDGCCGAILFGPIGMLCALCGISSETEEYWMCYSCGKKFQAGDYEAELENRADRVARLKKDIASLEADLKNKPDNLETLIVDAKAEYDGAEAARREFEKAFISTSGLLKIVNGIHTLISILAVGIFILGMVLGIAALGDGGLTVILLGIIISLLMISISGCIFNKVKQSVDREKADFLKKLEAERDVKEKNYKDLQKLKNKENSHQQKINELEQAEKALDRYSKT